MTFAESNYQAGFDIPTHTHAHAFFFLVVEGACEEARGHTTTLCGPSTLVFHPAGEPHANRWLNGGGRVLHIEISDERACDLRDRAPVLDGHAEFRGGVVLPIAMRLYREYRRPDGVSPLALEGIALEMLAESSRQDAYVTEGRSPRWLVRVHDYLHDRFNENPSLSEIGAAAGIHPVHLARTFRRKYGCSPGEYLRRLRVEFAAQLLATTDKSLVEIALSAGFSDQSHFTKTFRCEMRTTPAVYRRNFRALR
jgi:AraC family transcriptional regulator